MNQFIEGNIVDIIAEEIYPAQIEICEGHIKSIKKSAEKFDTYILPGLIDSHVHIESSMLTPVEFARLAVVHGSVGAVCDPHEIANVLGEKGIDFMLDNASLSPFHFYFGAPSCVPATSFETSGATLNADDVGNLLKRDDIYFLSEMMNFPGVLNNDKEVIKKLAFAHKYNKPVDGHAPGLTAENIKKYAQAGISTDHECIDIPEAEAKINAGMHILIREGSAARNFDALIPLIEKYPEKIMFCSDDKHPDELAEGHINRLVKRAISKGYNVMDVIKAATLNPVRHYKLNCGLLQQADPADFIVVDNLKDFNVLKTFIHGKCVAEKGATLLPSESSSPLNNFCAQPISLTDIQVPAKKKTVNVIQALEHSLYTPLLKDTPAVENGNYIADLNKDLLKIVILNRYIQKPAVVGFIQGFGLKNAALASTVAHDSHNIICVGSSDDTIVNAINALIEKKGGIVISENDRIDSLELPIAGLLSNKEGYEVAEEYKRLNEKAKMLCNNKLSAPFMTLSFMALLVIPEIKIGDKGLFDVNLFNFIDVYA